MGELQEKIDQQVAKIEELEEEIADLKDKNETLEEKVEELEEKVSDLENDLDSVQDELSAAGNAIGWSDKQVESAVAAQTAELILEHWPYITLEDIEELLRKKGRPV